MSGGQDESRQPVPAREVARQLGLSIVTVRQYEHGNLIDELHITQDADGKHLYDAAAVERLRALLEVCGTGVAIEEMRTIAAALDDGTLTDERRLELLERIASRLDQEVSRLGVVRRNVAAKIEQLKARVR